MRYRTNKIHSDKNNSDAKCVRIYDNIFLFIFSLNIVLFVWNETGNKRYVGFAGIIFCLYLLYALLKKTRENNGNIFPLICTGTISPELSNKIIDIFFTRYFLFSLAILALEVGLLENTIQGMELWWYSVIAGFLASTLVLLYLGNSELLLHFKRVDRNWLFVIFIGSTMLLFSGIGSYINHSTSNGELKIREVEFVSKSIGGKSRNTYYIYVKTSKEYEESFKVTKEFFDNVSNNKNIILHTRVGGLGYEIVYDFSTENRRQK